MYYKGKLEANSTTSLSSRYGYIKVSSKNEGAVVVTGKYGKNYWIFYSKTPKGSYIGEKLFPRVAVKVVWSKDYTIHVWIKSTSKKRKRRWKKNYNPYGNGKFDYAMSPPFQKWSKRY